MIEKLCLSAERLILWVTRCVLIIVGFICGNGDPDDEVELRGEQLDDLGIFVLWYFELSDK